MKRLHAIVVGGGISGLLSAKILSESFEKVTLMDRDPSLGSAVPRSGAVQGYHLHVLLKRGQDILKEIFPDIEKAFEDADCPRIDWAKDTKWKIANGIFPRYESDTLTFSLSRPFLEARIFQRVSKIGNIVIKRLQVLKIDANHSASARVATKEEGEFFADIVVIAGGQNFNFDSILPASNIGEFSKVIPIHITYRSVIYETKSLNFSECKQYYYQASPPQDSIGAVICPMENERTVATIVEYGNKPLINRDLKNFIVKAKDIPCPEFLKIVENGTSLSEVSTFYKPNMHMRYLDKIRHFPKNVFVVGDAFCSVNPVFGQGMTLALEQIVVLKNILNSENLDSKKFHRKCRKVAHFPFFLAQVGSVNHRTFLKRYLVTFLKRCRFSIPLHNRFLKALHLTGSYRSLFDLRSFISTVFLYD